jgi:DNA polymerase elongation subunit (family B)
MKSYINVYQDSARTIKHLYIEDGIASEETVAFKPFLGVPAMSSENTSWTDIYGRPAKIKVFNSIPEMKEWKKENDIGFDILGDVAPSIQFIATQYKKEIEIQKAGMVIWNIDIEVYVPASKGFCHAEKAEWPINAVTIHEMVSDTYKVLSLKDYEDDRPNVSYTKCRDEKNLLNKLLELFETDKPHIITGWNIELFDIPYIVNRVNNILGEDDVKRLSRERTVKKREATNSTGKKEFFYSIQGLIIWDYINLYKKYQVEPRERYSLSFISQYELDKDKVDYSEYENLSELYQQDFKLFIEYNIADTTLVSELDKKLGYIDLAISIMYKTRCSPDSIFGTVQPWDCLIYNELLRRKMLCPPNKHGLKTEFPGGFVKTPQVGLHEWVAVYDIVSSYPNQIRSFNISPETIINDAQVPDELRRVAEELAYYKDDNDTDKDRCPCEDITAIEKYTELFDKYDVCFTANGRFFKKEVEGIIPSIYSKLFNERLGYKKLSKDKKNLYANTKDPKVKHEMEQAELYSYTLKILLNSGYGALANPHGRYFDLRIAGAITTNGQACCRGVGKYLNETFTDIDHIYSDTDSIFCNLSKLVKRRFPNGEPNKQDTLDFILKFNKTIFEPKINGYFDRLRVAMNMRELTINMEAECVADVSIHTAKKRYIMSKVWDEGTFHVEKPKLKIRGVEIVRTSTPQIVRDKLKEAVNLIFETKSNDVLIEYVNKVKEDFFKASFEDIAFPRSVTFSNYTLTTKGTPIGVRAALIHNKFIQDNKLKDKYQQIADGDKIKFCFIKEPNMLKSNVVGIVSKLSEELNNVIEIDYELQFQKTFLAPLQTIFTAINWYYEKKNDLSDFFS